MQAEHTELSTLRKYPRKLEGVGLPADTLPELIDSPKPVILYFLRHFGCVHCKYIVRKLHALGQQHARFPDIVFVHQESLEKGKAFFAKNFPGASHISNPSGDLYKLFKVNRMSSWALLSPSLWGKALARAFRGYGFSLKPTSDPLKLSAMFLFFHGKLLWSHKARFAGDDKRALARIAQLGNSSEKAESSASDTPREQTTQPAPDPA